MPGSAAILAAGWTVPMVKESPMSGVGGALAQDREIRRADVQTLSSRDQVAALFAEEHTRQVVMRFRLQHLVFDLYGLMPEEVQLLRSTAPPRDPLALVKAAGTSAGLEDRKT